MPVTVAVRAVAHCDDATVAAALGEQPLPTLVAPGSVAPFITIGGRIHRPSSDFQLEQSLDGLSVPEV